MCLCVGDITRLTIIFDKNIEAIAYIPSKSFQLHTQSKIKFAYITFLNEKKC